MGLLHVTKQYEPPLNSKIQWLGCVLFIYQMIVGKSGVMEVDVFSSWYPWIIGGDLNMIEHLEDKIGGMSMEWKGGERLH